MPWGRLLNFGVVGVVRVARFLFGEAFAYGCVRLVGDFLDDRFRGDVVKLKPHERVGEDFTALQSCVDREKYIAVGFKSSFSSQEPRS